MDFTIWFLIGAAFVFFMQAGFAMVETGFTRAKNAGNIIMKNLIDFCIGAVVFMLLGFSLLVGLEAVGHFCGVPNLGMFADFDAFITNENGLASNFVFNLVFCATAATIVSGAMAERTRFAAYCVYSALISLVVYPIEAGWIWGLGDNAWLTSMGFADFAGSTAIHMVGGTAALIGAAMEGARLGKYERDDNGKVIKVNAIQGHNIPIGALGVFYGDYGYLLGMQVAGIVTVITWASVCMIIIFGAIKYVPVMIKFKTANPAKVLAYGKTWNGLRAGAEEEVIGLDIMEHGLTSAYADFQLNVPILDGEATDVDVSDVVTADIDLAPAKSVGRYTKVTIITAQDKFLTLKDALAQIGVTGMTVSSVMGCGVQAGKIGQYRGVKTSMHLIPKVQVDIVVSTVDPKLVVAVARKVLDDGKVGAGKIFVSDIENVMRVRTGETGEKALDNAT